MHRIRLSAQVAAAGVLAFAALIALEHVLVPRLGPSDHMISEYANTRGVAGAVAVAALAAWGISFLAAALLTSLAAPRGWATRVMVGCLCFAGLGLAVAAVFPTQAVGGVVPHSVQRTLAGRLHDLGSGGAELAIFAAVVVSLRAVPWSPRLRAAAVAVVAAGLILGPALTALGAGAHGLRQRGLAAAACAWELALVATLARSAENR
jgi:hypothetical protein